MESTAGDVMTYMFVIDYQSLIAHSLVGTHMLLYAPIASPVTLHTTMAAVKERKEEQGRKD